MEIFEKASNLEAGESIKAISSAMSGALLAAFFTLGRIHDWNWQFVQEMIKEVNQQQVILNLANWGAVALYFLVAPVIAMAFVKHKRITGALSGFYIGMATVGFLQLLTILREVK